MSYFIWSSLQRNKKDAKWTRASIQTGWIEYQYVQNKFYDKSDNQQPWHWTSTYSYKYQGLIEVTTGLIVQAQTNLSKWAESEK